jgi:hypothetical protein
MPSYTTYKYAVGLGNTMGLADFVYQPNSEGVQYPEYVINGDGSMTGLGDRFVVLRWQALHKAKFYTVMNALGLVSALYSDITITAPDHMTRTFAAYSGRVRQPRPGVDYHFKRASGGMFDIQLTITGLV